MPRRTSAPPPSADDPWTLREGVLWGALAVALSACWIDLAGHWAAQSWARPSALFLALVVLAATREMGRETPRADGWVLVVAGVALTLFATGGGVPRLGRPGLAIAVVGMARALGRPSLGVALLVLWVLPPPFALSRILSPGIEHWLGVCAAHALRISGRQATLGPGGLEVDGALLPLTPTDGGVPLAIYFAGVGWWTAVRRGRELLQAARAALRLAPLGLVAQVLALGCAFAVLAGGSVRAARGILDVFPWLAIALAIGVASARADRWALPPRTAESLR